MVDCGKVWKIHVRKKECRYKNEHTDRCRSGVDRRFYIGVTGDVQAASVLIGGEVTGNITAPEKAELTASAKVLGDIATKVIVIDEHAVFQGKIDMNQTVPDRKGKARTAKAVRAGRKSAKAAIAEALKEVEEEEKRENQETSQTAETVEKTETPAAETTAANTSEA